jgi:hypothetical protein
MLIRLVEILPFCLFTVPLGLLTPAAQSSSSPVARSSVIPVCPGFQAVIEALYRGWNTFLYQEPTLKST